MDELKEHERICAGCCDIVDEIDTDADGYCDNCAAMLDDEDEDNG